MTEPRTPRPADLCVEPAFLPPLTTRPLASPIYLSSVYACDDTVQADRILGGQEPGYVYARDGHPNAALLADRCRRLHGAGAAWVCSSGMSALSAVLLARCTPQDTVLASTRLYGKSLALLDREFSRLGGKCLTVDLHDEGAYVAALAARPKLVVLETITNPLLRVADLERIAELAHAAGAEVVVDNTFAGPTLVRPLERGADFVLESITKIMNGHSDVVLGMVAAKSADLPRLGAVISTWGLAAAPFDCWLALRGLGTLALRADESARQALAAAELLAGSPVCEAVHYPGLPGHPDHEIARRLLDGTPPTGPFPAGAMVTFTLRGGTPAAEAFIRGSDIPFCPSLADLGTTLSHPATTSHRALSPADQASQGIFGGTIRLSVGIESTTHTATRLTAGLTAIQS